jgi:hypothetical protein
MGEVEWTLSISLDTGTPFFDVMNIGEIDGGPGFFLLAVRQGDALSNDVDPYVLIELDANHQVVLAKHYVDIGGNCERGVLGHRGRAYRETNGGYLLSLPNNVNFTCLYGLDALGDSVFTELLSPTPGATNSLGGISSLQLQDGSILLLNIAGVSLDLQMMRLAETGAYLWSRTYVNDYLHDYPTAAVQVSTDSIVVMGIHGLSSSEHWGFALKMDLDGNIGWHRRFDLTDGPMIGSGTPESITVMQNGEFLVRFRPMDHAIVARFDQSGVLLEAMDLIPPHNAWTFYDDFEVLHSSQGYIALAGHTQSVDCIMADDSVMLSKVTDLSQLQCYVQPHFWYEELDTTAFAPLDSGAITWSPWYRTLDLSCTVDTSGWIGEPYCTSTPVDGASEDLGLLIYPSIVSLGTSVRIVALDEPIKSGYVVSMNGTTNSTLITRQDYDSWLISTDPLCPGVHVVRVFTHSGKILSARFVLTN